MNSVQIAALSQVQARAIVNARKSVGTAEQIQTQIQLQTQALVHAHTQAQISAGIYKGEAKGGVKTSTPAPVAVVSAAAVSVASAPVVDNKMIISSSMSEVNAPTFLDADGLPQPSATSPQFLAQLSGSLNQFWQESLQEIQNLQDQTEQDFKNHNDLPLARIKRIMKSDEDVRMISAEAPVLFAKACELFILDLSIRAWNYSQLHKRRTLQKEDVREAIQKTDIFDFLVDVIQ
jgi:histone H3/H4